MSVLPIILAAVIELTGVTARELRAIATFNSNNVRTGDPMTLRVEFRGEAELGALHPPAISRVVDSRVWKVDDRSARTMTANGVRRLEYRVRPLQEGLFRFPSLEFACHSVTGGMLIVRTTELPVRIRRGLQVTLEGLEEDENSLPMPDALIFTPSVVLSEDAGFDWRKACNEAKADGFAAFDFPEARLNEAACRTLEGNWARALSIYRRLEWSIGQTPSIERGIVAALARKGGDSAAELPVWRALARPVLKYPWLPRLGIVGGVLFVLIAVFCGLGRIIRKLAVFVLVLGLPAVAMAADDEVTALLRLPKTTFVVGEEFEFAVEVECSRDCQLDNLNLRPVPCYGFKVTKDPWVMTDLPAAVPSNVVHRVGFAGRFNAPSEGKLVICINGMRSISRQTRSAFGFSSFTSSCSFSAITPAVSFVVKPLDDRNRPADFQGLVGQDFSYIREIPAGPFCTNEVITVTERLQFIGFAPEGIVPDEIVHTDRIVTWRSYFVADGCSELPSRSFSYYDVEQKTYRRVSSLPVRLRYKADDVDDEAPRQVAINSGTAQKNAVRLRFTPDFSAPTVTVSTVPLSSMRELERHGEWRRMDDGEHIGWCHP